MRAYGNFNTFQKILLCYGNSLRQKLNTNNLYILDIYFSNNNMSVLVFSEQYFYTKIMLFLDFRDIDG